MADLTYFDCHAVVGKRGEKDPAQIWRTEDLLQEMQHCGISGALVYHGLAREYDCAYGNRLLLDELEKSPRLFGCWVVLPHHTGEMPPPRQLIAEMQSHDVRAAKLCPTYHRFAFDRYTCGPLLDALAEEGLPVLMHIAELGGRYEALTEFCLLYPGLRLIVQGASWGQERFIFPLMERCENVYIEFSTFQANGILEIMSRRFGAERLLFGTEAPVKSIGAARAFVDYAQIPAAQKAAIAGGNLARLLGVRPPKCDPASGSDSIVSRAQAGQPLDDMLVIDAHAHVGHLGAQGVGPIPMPEADIDHMIAKNRLLGIDKVCISSWLGIYPPDAEAGNDVTKQAIDRYPDDVVGYATIDPTYTDDIAAEIERCYETYGFKGVKPYPRNGLPFDSPEYTPWWEYANERRLFALMHGGLPQVEKLSEAYPEISFLLAHSGGSYKTARQNCALAEKRQNVYLEITLTPVPLGVIELMVSEVGAERVIFGTDAPMRDPRPQFGWLAYARIPEADKRKIFGENMKHIIDRCR